MDHTVSRRVVLQLVGAGAAAAGASACSRGPREFIVPYVDQPPEVTPSVPSRYATVASLAGYGVGILAESHEGRPTKLEGNPRHPASLGALSALEQASLLDLYDPPRARALVHGGMPTTWHAFCLGDRRSAPAGEADPRAARADERPAPRRPRAARTRARRRRRALRRGALASRRRGPGRSSRSAGSSSRATTSRAPTSSCRSTRTSSAPTCTPHRVDARVGIAPPRSTARATR